MKKLLPKNRKREDVLITDEQLKELEDISRDTFLNLLELQGGQRNFIERF